MLITVCCLGRALNLGQFWGVMTNLKLRGDVALELSVALMHLYIMKNNKFAVISTQLDLIRWS